MTSDLETGHRQTHGVEPTQFEAFEFERDNYKEYLYGHAEVCPVELTTILGVLDDMYGRVRQEHLGGALDRNNSSILTLYTPEGVWAFEDHDRDLLVVQVEEADHDAFLRAVDDAFSPGHYRDIGIDPQAVINAAP
jgi:hypothetical protein